MDEVFRRSLADEAGSVSGTNPTARLPRLFGAAGPSNSLPGNARQSHAHAGSANRSFVPSAHYTIAAPTTAHHSATGPAHMTMHYHAGYPMQRLLSPAHCVTGNIGARPRPISRVRMPNTADYYAKREVPLRVAEQVARAVRSSAHPLSSAHEKHASYGSMVSRTAQAITPRAMQHDATHGARVTKGQQRSLSKTSVAAAVRAARIRKLRAKRNRRSMNGGNTFPAALTMHFDDHCRGRKIPLSKEEKRLVEDRGAVQRCRNKRKLKYEELQKETELHDKDRELLRSMCQRQKRFLSAASDGVSPELIRKLQETLVSMCALPTKRPSDLDE